MMDEINLPVPWPTLVPGDAQDRDLATGIGGELGCSPTPGLVLVHSLQDATDCRDTDAIELNHQSGCGRKFPMLAQMLRHPHQIGPSLSAQTKL